MIKGEDKVDLYSATVAIHEPPSAALSSQAEPANSLGHSPSPRSRILACSHTVVLSLS